MSNTSTSGLTIFLIKGHADVVLRDAGATFRTRLATPAKQTSFKGTLANKPLLITLVDGGFDVELGGLHYHLPVYDMGTDKERFFSFLTPLPEKLAPISFASFRKGRS